MQPRHVLPSRLRRHKLAFDLVKRQWRCIDQASAGRAICQQLCRHDRAGIQANWTSPKQVTSTDRNKVGGSRTSTDEMHGHAHSSLTARAQVAAPKVIRGTRSRAAGPPAASAAASATDETPDKNRTRSERVF